MCMPSGLRSQNGSSRLQSMPVDSMIRLAWKELEEAGMQLKPVRIKRDYKTAITEAA